MLRMNKKSLSIIIIILMVVLALSGYILTKKRNGAESWTLCLYLCGSNLESEQGWASRTIQELEEADIPENVMVVQIGGSEEWHNDQVKTGGNGRYELDGGELVLLEKSGKESMGEDKTLASFLEFCAERYPSKHSAVIFWNHGGGPMKGACFDESDDFNALSLDEMDKAFQKGVAARKGKKYDIVGFDACLMGTLETAMMLSDDADYLVGSEEIEPGAGWDYTVPVDAMGEASSVKKVAIAICDGFKQKCESRHKSATATLSVVDLSKVHGVSVALDNALNSLRITRGKDVNALRRLADGARHSENFGGISENEGSSNLIDIKGLAQSLSEDKEMNGSGWEELAKAVDSAVVHHINGTSTKGANGLSIWYPRMFSEQDLVDYTGTTTLNKYATTLKNLFSASIEHIDFKDPGSIHKDGVYYVTIAPKSKESFFDLYIVNRRVDGDYTDYNVDRIDDWNKLTFGYDMSNALKLTINGLVLDYQVISYDMDSIVFACPVTVNGAESNLRIAWIWDTYEEGHYEFLGTWNGVDHENGMTDRLDDQLSPGDVVGAVSLTTGEVRDTVTIGQAIVVEDGPLEEGKYECYFVALDLHGNKYFSNSVSYRVDADGKTTVLQ